MMNSSKNKKYISTEEFQFKKNLLATVAYQTNPDTQDVRENAYEILIKQLLWLDSGDGISVQRLQKEMAKSYYLTLSHDSFWRILNKMRNQNQIHITKEFVSLAENERKTISHIFEEAHIKLTRVVNKVFGTNEQSMVQFEAQFLFIISNVFAMVGEKSVRLFKGEIVEEKLIRHCIDKSISLAKQTFKKLRQDYMRSRIVEFFRNTQDVDFSSIKQNLSQNYFIAKAIRIDPSGRVLTKSVFGNSIIFIDTNILVSGLDPMLKDHEITKAVVDYFDRLGSSMRIAGISLKEIKRLGKHFDNIFSKIGNQDVLDDILHDMHGSDIAKLYIRKKKENSLITLDKVIVPFLSPDEPVQQFFNAKIENSTWFKKNINSENVKKFSEKLELLYLDLKKSHKHKMAALHDALVLLWIEEEFAAKHPKAKIWFLTKDFSLTEESLKEFYSHRIITLDTFLQWMFPQPNGNIPEFQDIYSDLIQKRLLPQDITFNAMDFDIFERLGMSIDEMDSEKVEEMYRYISNNLQNINTADPRSREKIHRVMQNYMIDPLTKHGQEFNKSKSLNQEYQQYFANINRAKKARIRFAFILIVIVAVCLGVILLSDNFGIGTNLFQKIVYAWGLLAFGLVVISGLIAYCLFSKGWRENIRYLWWNRKRYLKNHPELAEDLSKNV